MDVVEYYCLDFRYVGDIIDVCRHIQVYQKVCGQGVICDFNYLQVWGDVGGEAILVPFPGNAQCWCIKVDKPPLGLLYGCP